MSNPDYRLKKNLPGLKAGVPLVFNKQTQKYETTTGRSYEFTAHEVETMREWFEKINIETGIPEAVNTLKKGLTFGQIIAFLEEALKKRKENNKSTKCESCGMDFTILIKALLTAIP